MEAHAAHVSDLLTLQSQFIRWRAASLCMSNQSKNNSKPRGSQKTPVLFIRELPDLKGTSERLVVARSAYYYPAVYIPLQGYQMEDVSFQRTARQSRQ
jgi:hypothetical protein